MKPIPLEQILEEVFWEDIKELSKMFPAEFPELFKKITTQLNINEKHLYITDFVEDENADNHYFGYLFDAQNRQMYRYAFEGDKATFTPVEVSSLTTQDTFSLKVLHLLT